MKKAISFIALVLIFSQLKAQYTTTDHGLKATVNDICIELQCYGPATVRVLKYPATVTLHKQSLSVVREAGDCSPTVERRGDIAVLRTGQVQASLDLRTGKVVFSRQESGRQENGRQENGSTLFAEKDYGVQFTPETDAGKSTYDVRQAFLLDKDEAIYGLGQQQNGRLDQRNQRNLLAQGNTKVAIPYFLSVKGYAVFWDNYSPTLFTDNPQETSFDSQVGDCADYYFMSGSNADSVLAQMRALTGQAPMMPLWVYGYNQSKERYKTQFELVDVVKKYRALHVPLDGIIQDWQYWGKDSNWNAMSFDPTTYPEPQKMVDSVHALHAHLFIVAWPGFGPQTKPYAELQANHMLLHFDTWPPNGGALPYDVYNPAARVIYWKHLNKGIFSLGTDAWWLDSSEPDHINEKESDFDLPTYLGSYRSVRNAFPLEHISGIYEHQRQTTEAKRVSILTRSAFAGQQRYGANTWSGDIRSSWSSFRTQIPAGLNFSLTGIPYWNTDIGGFFAWDYVNKGGASNPEFRELYTRWIQFGAFMPLMRSHGTDIPREIYNFGKKGDTIYDAIDRFINMRYALLPYLYATAHNVTAHAGTFMRALFMDFATDPLVRNIGNEYLFGASILVMPVAEKGATTQSVYLPAGASWIDFWTGEKVSGGQRVEKATPINILPLYVRAGAIIPWGPKVEYASEKKWDELEIRVYPGANADFTLYEDEGDGYNYEKGKYTEIGFHWDDASRTLTVDDRKGAFAGALESRKFRVVLVNEQQGTGAELSLKVNKVVRYDGRKLSIKL